MKAVRAVEAKDFITVPTKKGTLRVNALHGKQEMTENITIARRLAEKYNEEIDLLPVLPNQKNPDSFNRTRGINQEYKVSKNTKTAIDTAIRNAKSQADYIVIKINGDIDNGLLINTIKARVFRSENIKEVIIINGRKVLKMSRSEIIKSN